MEILEEQLDIESPSLPDSEGHLCLECGLPYDVSLLEFNNGLCFACNKGFLKEESVKERKISMRKRKLFSRKNGDSNFNRIHWNGHRTMPRGVYFRDDEKYPAYVAKYGPFYIKFGVKKHGERNAFEMAKKVRKKMEELGEVPLIEDYLEKLRKGSKNKKRGTKKSLPIGVGFFNGNGKKQSAGYKACMVIAGKKYQTAFSIPEFGEKKAYEMALKARKRMESLKSPMKIMKFLAEEVPKWRKEHSTKRNGTLPTGVYHFRGGKKTGEFYRAHFIKNREKIAVTFAVSIFGENSLEFAIYSRKQMERIGNIEKIRMFMDKEIIGLREHGKPDLHYKGEEGYYEYDPDQDLFEGEIFVQDELITFSAKEFKNLRKEMLRAIRQASNGA